MLVPAWAAANLAPRQFAKLVERAWLEQVRLANTVEPLLNVFRVLLNLVHH